MSTIPSLVEVMEAMHAAEAAADAVFQASVKAADATLLSLHKGADAVFIEGGTNAHKAYKRSVAEAVARANDERTATLTALRATHQDTIGQARTTRDAEVEQTKQALEEIRTRAASIWTDYLKANAEAVSADDKASLISATALTALSQLKNNAGGPQS